MGNCQYRYKDGEQCIIRNLPEGKEMCVDHVLITQIAKDKAKYDDKRPKTLSQGRPSRAKPKVEQVYEKPKNTSCGDPTAPWKCNNKHCAQCENKPTYDDYMRSRGHGSGR